MADQTQNDHASAFPHSNPNPSVHTPNKPPMTCPGLRSASATAFSHPETLVLFLASRRGSAGLLLCCAERAHVFPHPMSSLYLSNPVGNVDLRPVQPGSKLLLPQCPASSLDAEQGTTFNRQQNYIQTGRGGL
ncbi:hypothetical protein BaRGS_00021813 [Batillaria attramentaria]|uniref:Uncharacterized protein n=1 Tax=Batillaria attramentaria TaxID=370345 RepID=A0ABD0KJ37_9CAEN